LVIIDLFLIFMLSTTIFKIKKFKTLIMNNSNIEINTKKLLISVELVTTLANPMSRKILQTISAHGKISESDIIFELGENPSAISDQLIKLRKTDLLEIKREGETTFFNIQIEKIQRVSNAINRMLEVNKHLIA